MSNATTQPVPPPAEDAGAVVVVLDPPKEQKPKRDFSALKPFAIISVSYLLYTTTDGAIRMIVLLQAYNLGFSAWDVAIMFTAYELAGVFTNLAAGTMGAAWGIKTTLLTGLTLQLAGLGMLFAWQDSWSEPGQKYKAILFVTFAQMLCGIAKDLTKLGGKTVTKLVTPDEKQARLFKLVSLITGWKNSLKGAGYFLGAVCVAYNYYFALGILILLILLAYPWAVIGLSNQLGRATSKNRGLFEIFKQKYNVNILSLSRFFLFGSRDLWFEVPLPFFLRNVAQGLGWSRPITGLFLAVWIIVYGQAQSWTPQLFLQPLRQSPANGLVALLWCSVLVVLPFFLGGMTQFSSVFLNHELSGMEGALITGLYMYCLIFAINSAVHSYLIVKYSEGDKVAMNIGAYYAANSVGRFVGTLVGGALYSFVDTDSVLPGFAACFWASGAFAVASTLVDVFLRDKQTGLRLGPCLTLVPPLLAVQEPETPRTLTLQDSNLDHAGNKDVILNVDDPPSSTSVQAHDAHDALAAADGSAFASAVEVLLSPERDLALHLAGLRGRSVLLRADLNVPVRAAADGAVEVADRARIDGVLPTVRTLLNAGAKVAIASHFGRPQPAKQDWAQMQATNSLQPVAAVLAAELGARFTGLAPDCVGPRALAAVSALQPGQACLLENTRFHAGDVDNDPAFAQALAALADVFVCDAFGVMHRDQASVTGIVPHMRLALPGPLVRHELRFLMKHLERPVRPLAVVVGGAKVADKLGVLRALILKADVVLVGGRMAFTFLAAKGVSMGATQVEEDRLADARAMLDLAAQRRVVMLLPCDVRVSRSLEQAQGMHVVPLTRDCCSPDAPCLPEGQYGIDVGPATELAFTQALTSCKTIFWNGPMGKFEVPEFASGTHAMARAIAQSTARGAITIVGGGDSVAAVNEIGLGHSFSHISTGGGASLELVEGRPLPGVMALAQARLPAEDTPGLQ